MASGLASLASYDSDSDDQDAAPALVTAPSSHVVSTAPAPAASSSKLGSLLPPPKAGLTSKLPPPSSSSKGSGLSLPPPTSSSSSKRKVIKIDSLNSFKESEDGADSDDAAEGSANSKKPKLAIGATNGGSSKHSLFGMLPAPKRKDDEVLAERSRQAEARKAAKAVEGSDTQMVADERLRFHAEAEHASSHEAPNESATASNSKTKGKNNDAFRAMLGLKPSTAAKPNPSAASTSSTARAHTGTAPRTSSSHSAVQLPASSHSAAETAAIPTSKPDAAAPVDFFSISTAPRSSKAASSSQTSSFSISAAPVIDHPKTQQSEEGVDSGPNDESEYPGWQLDPDGSWVPVTPEAQAQFLAYQQSTTTPSAPPTSKSASNLDGTRDLIAAGLTPEDIQAFDASSAARQAYLSADGDEADSDKYAAAAEFAAGNREIQQRKPGMLKGLRKGQLSSLVSLAGENRAKLEKRWQRGREQNARRTNQYGF
ncbi:hypothetical protein PHSY_000796 [Pseudozyma hubeiensis SY62]|uniref:Mitotic checkpoint regulator, MAD2B-interacting-domain-containing protein n=1 Tax=Pseudozyma hubeiensis (strain SY62) TaxID=1305764 RepID=R9NX59_PSEHS|nr:hypothetical protein PHSY_000796 [Pseudozyma hubeiensis SY62]GAC93233.1 hypothetical protein PHSY_000796 [Pseudozyma hubeiensis SY62]